MNYFVSLFSAIQLHESVNIMASQKNRLHRLFGFSLPDWKEASIQPDDVAEIQVIGAGLARTGTSSLKAALEILGFDPCHHMVVSSLHIKSQRA